jgi:hypothetical protein
MLRRPELHRLPRLLPMQELLEKRRRVLRLPSRRLPPKEARETEEAIQTQTAAPMRIYDEEKGERIGNFLIYTLEDGRRRVHNTGRFSTAPQTFFYGKEEITLHQGDFKDFPPKEKEWHSK